LERKGAKASEGDAGRLETPQERMRRGGSVHAPRKASIPTFQSTNAFLKATKLTKTAKVKNI